MLCGDFEPAQSTIRQKWQVRLHTDKWANPQLMWDERFSQAEPVYGEEPNAYLRAQVARLKPGGNILVPGDGYGRNGIWLARQGFRVRTVDLSAVGVARAQKAARAAGVSMTIEQADLSVWRWPEAEFDAAACIFLQLAPQVRTPVHRNVFRGLKPGGFLILEAFTPAQLQHRSGGPKQVELLYTADILRQDFPAAEVLEMHESEIQLDEGRLHRGSAAVVRAVFRRK
jgi:SAM-dependent methyltransferase